MTNDAHFIHDCILTFEQYPHFETNKHKQQTMYIAMLDYIVNSTISVAFWDAALKHRAVIND
jgi:hypothetical protein